MSNNYNSRERLWMAQAIAAGLPARLSPSRIDSLEPGEVFVFGSNVLGHHAGGAARAAVVRFGAVWGIGEGLQGQSYAIPTMEGMTNMAYAVGRFTSFARQHQELRFLVTAIGCGIAGHTPAEVAPLFAQAAQLPNVYLPMGFWKVLLNA